jgi:hypothetical protein
MTYKPENQDKSRVCLHALYIHGFSGCEETIKWPDGELQVWTGTKGTLFIALDTI